MILVTGGTGLVGAHLLLHLLENKEETIRAIYRNQKHIAKTKSLFGYYDKGELFSNIEWVLADILDVPSLEVAFENVDYVFHCAGFISFNPDDEENLRKTNIEGTANIVNFCIDKKVKKLCHVSSIAALGKVALKEIEVTEETEWNPEILHSDYAISKYGAEMEVWRGLQEGLQVIVVNPGIILGPGFWNHGSGTLILAIKKGFPFYTYGSSGYIAVTDVVTIMNQLMDADCSGERFILISENRTYKDIITTIAKKLEVKNPSIEASPFLLKIAWRMDFLIAKILRGKRKLSKHSSISLQNTEKYSNEKIQTYLNYSFEKIDTYLDTILASHRK